MTIYSAGLSTTGELFHPENTLSQANLNITGVIAIDSTSTSVYVLTENGDLFFHSDGIRTNLREQLDSAARVIKCAEDKAFILTASGQVFMHTQKLTRISFACPIELMTATKDSLWGIGNNNDFMAMTEGRFGFPKVTMNVGSPVIAVGAIQVGQEFIGAIATEGYNWNLWYISPRFFQKLPKPENAPEAFAKFYSRDGNVVGVTPDGDAYSLGFNDYGQLGNGETEHAFSFQKIKLPDNEKVVSAAYGSGFLLLLTESGNVFSCGKNDHGQLMIDQTGNQSEPKPIKFDQKVAAVYAGYAQAYLNVSSS
jgi:alpha-tubulin suppressor-like RCC1 family protein